MSLPRLNTITITAPSGVDGRGEIAVLNNTASSNFVGYLFKETGFGGVNVRQSKDPVVEGAGSVFGNFYDDERPFTLEALLRRGTTWSVSDDYFRKLCRATDAKKADGTIVWTDHAGTDKQISFRRESGPSDPDEVAHTLFSGICADPLIYTASDVTGISNTSHTLNNAGNIDSPWFSVTIASPSATCTITNSTTSQTFTFTGLNGGGTVTIDFKAKTITQGGVSKLSAVSWPSSKWITLAPGNNSLTYTNAATPTHRSAWNSA